MVDKPNERVGSQGTTDRRSAWGSATSSTGSFASVLHSTVTTGGPSGISSAFSAWIACLEGSYRSTLTSLFFCDKS
jgi:hypothetical protein